jgi:hypothetical protein
MHTHDGMISDFIIIAIFLYWITYSVAVIIYLNYLTRKYLLPSERDVIVGDKSLKTHHQILEQFEHADEINVLILTGGGLRGLIPLHVLSYIEEKTGKKIGELFDFASGSSTGAISVSSLMVGDDNGGYKFSATEVRNNYYNHASRMFSSPWYHQFLTMFGLFAPRFLPDNKIKVLEEFFGDTTLGELKGNILIPVYNIDENNLQIVKNWNPPHGHSNDNYLTKDLINGASSPPMLFPPVAFRLKGRDHLFIDPAVILNNPILQVLLQMQILFPNKKLNMILIGNGGTEGIKYDYRSMFGFGLYGIYQYLFSAPALSSKLYIDFLEDYLRDASRFNDKISYFRINSIPENSMSPTNTGERNLQEIIKFADKMLDENKELIDKIIYTITKSRNYSHGD